MTHDNGNIIFVGIVIVDHACWDMPDFISVIFRGKPDHRPGMTYFSVPKIHAMEIVLFQQTKAIR